MTPNTALANYDTYTASSVMVGDLVILQGSIVLTKATNWGSDGILLFRLPEAAWPKVQKNLLRLAVVYTSGGTLIQSIYVTTDGAVRMRNTQGISGVEVVSLPGLAYRTNA